MNKKFKVQAQGGFTLIELIVVIVLLGILAATALPKFVNLGADARYATLKAAQGSLNAVAVMTHARALVAPGVATVATEKGNVTMDTTSNYPSLATNAAATALLGAAGITTADYQFVNPGSAATASLPATNANEVAIVPVSLKGSPKGLTCYVKYVAATTVNAPPTINLLPATAATAGTAC